MSETDHVPYFTPERFGFLWVAVGIGMLSTIAAQLVSATIADLLYYGTLALLLVLVTAQSVGYIRMKRSKNNE